MSEFEVFCLTWTKYESSIALSNFQLDRNWFKFHLQWYWTDFFEMTNIEIISKKCSNSKSQFELQWFELELPYNQINLQWDDCYSDICDKMSEFEVFCSTRTKYGSSIALSNFQLDRNLFNFHLQWYWTDFFEMTNIEIISKKCSNLKCIWTTRSEYVSSIALSNFQLDRNWFKLSQQRHQIYFFEMANIGIISKKCSNSVSIWTTVWICVIYRALSNFQLDRNLFNFHAMILDRFLWDD